MIFASISSSVIMLEEPVQALLSQVDLRRKKASLIIALFGFIVATPLCLDLNFFSCFSDAITIFFSL